MHRMPPIFSWIWEWNSFKFRPVTSMQLRPIHLVSAYTWILCKAVSLLSRGWLFVTSWTVAHQVLLFMGFSRQEYWSGLPFPSSGDLPSPGTEPMCAALAGGFFTTEPPGKALSCKVPYYKCFCITLKGDFCLAWIFIRIDIAVSDLTLKRFSISVSSSCFVLISIKIEGTLWLFFPQPNTE